MSIDLTIKIGGEAGQGIQTVGQLIVQACRQAGLFAMAINDFESRIRGGHSFFQVRISDRPVHAPHHRVHMLICMNERTFKQHRDEVTQDGLIIINRDSFEGGPDSVLAVPVNDLAQQAGGAITANTVAAGLGLSLLGAPLPVFERVLTDQFKKRGGSVLEQNIAAAKLGYASAQNRSFKPAFAWPDTEAEGSGMLVDGAQALALGALAADCRLAAFYPMSPATSIMMNLAAWQDRFPLVVEQVEDEIAAANMIIGASYAGVRAITSTSGGGFCLMTEALGYAGIAELPMVIINAQRPGPATGLATRTGQGDLQFAIRAAQDDFPLLVFAPGSPAQAFDTTVRAFALSEKYQAPAIILVDQFFNDSLYILPEKFKAPDKIDYFTASDKTSDDAETYLRYALTDCGISPRCRPCQSTLLVMTAGNEHSPDGHISETPTDRTGMVDKRARKQQGMLSKLNGPEGYHAEAKTLLAGWGSTAGILREAVDMLRSDGTDAGCLHFCDLWPFPAEHARQALEHADRLFIVEGNSTAQFAQLLRQETGLRPAGTILKYDGRPFYPVEIYNSVINK